MERKDSKLQLFDAKVESDTQAIPSQIPENGIIYTADSAMHVSESHQTIGDNSLNGLTHGEVPQQKAIRSKRPTRAKPKKLSAYDERRAQQENPDKHPDKFADVDPDDIYLMNIRDGGDHTLLPREEIVTLVDLWQNAMKLKDILSSVTDIEERERLEFAIRQGTIARNTITEHNLKLAASVAKKYANPDLEEADLTQEANLGLMEAVDRFNPKLGYEFSTYAVWWIRHAVGRALADKGRSIRLPANLHEKVRKLNKAINHLRQENGEEPTRAEIAAKLGWTEKQVEKRIIFALPPASLSVQVGAEDSDTTYEEMLPDENAVVGLSLVQKQLSEVMENALLSLSPREAKILELRYGLRDGKEHTLEEVGEKFGLTRERIRQIEKDAFRKLRHPSRARTLKKHL